jgi:competence protein ComEC
VRGQGVGRRNDFPAVRPDARLRSALAAAQPRTLTASLWRAASAAVTQRRLFVLLPFSLISGLLCYAILPVEPSALHYMFGTALVTGLAGLGLFGLSLFSIRICVQLLALWIGFCLLPMHGLAFGTAMLRVPIIGSYELRVDEILSADDGAVRAIVSSIAPVDASRTVPVRRARLFIEGAEKFEIGDVLHARVRFAPVPGPVLPGSFDGQFHAYFNGIGAYGSTIGQVERLQVGSEADMARRIYALRSNVADRIDLTLTGESAGIGRAMTVGDQSAITDETRDVMAASGLAHVYSISGLHLSIVAGGMFWLVRLLLASLPIALSWPSKQIAAVIGLLSAVAYLLLAGGADNVPAFRSTLMLGLIFGAVLVGRRALTMRNVSIAAIAIILMDPASVFRASFQLSFAAVVALIGIYELPQPGKRARTGSAARFGAFIWGTAWTSFIAGSATLLFSAYHFQQTAPLGVLGNLLALPFVSLIMWFGALAILVMPFGLEAPFIWLMGWNIDRMVDVAKLVSEWSGPFTGNPLLAGWTLTVGLLALAWFAFLDGKWRLVCPILAIPVILSFGLLARPDVLISDSTQAVAMRDGDGLSLVMGRTGSFAVDVWGRHFQTQIGMRHPSARCDSLGCVAKSDAYSVAVIRNAAAFSEDCRGHDLVVARVRTPRGCGADGALVGPEQLASGGVHALYWDPAAGRFNVVAAMEQLRRPWRVQPR